MIFRWVILRVSNLETGKFCLICSSKKLFNKLSLLIMKHSLIIPNLLAENLIFLLIPWTWKILSSLFKMHPCENLNVGSLSRRAWSRFTKLLEQAAWNRSLWYLPTTFANSSANRSQNWWFAQRYWPLISLIQLRVTFFAKAC